jgi:Cell division cycle-associated protein 8
VVEQTASVNIPIPDGVLSLRPQMMDASNLNASFLNKIDPTTYIHLRTLKANLDIVMAGFSRKFNQ